MYDSYHCRMASYMAEYIATWLIKGGIINRLLGDVPHEPQLDFHPVRGVIKY
jgi:hypothetical protein